MASVFQRMFQRLWGKQSTSATTSAASSFIEQTLESSPVVIFSKSRCPYCRKAKQVFDDLKVSYHAVELDGRTDGSEIQKVLLQMTGASTVPRVFVNKQCLGGCSDLEEMYEKNKLQTLLKSCGLLQ
ncbi:uncharacterized protein LOC119400964 isoform X1 [Rhipicephalus sanguineus]|uniref:uncharacterized protein LOC119400964 isoform X1 n=2 Tax=Rhipicephalus sanguineus TaxID=34632 RepID=UPI0018942E1D|nr:uncharacterized protein LOC119400964 isoform X1 [Rhipicephalus sanguineus]